MILRLDCGYWPLVGWEETGPRGRGWGRQVREEGLGRRGVRVSGGPVEV